MNYLNQNAQEEKDPLIQKTAIAGLNLSSLLIGGAVLWWLMKK